MSKLALAVAGRHTKKIQRMAILNGESGDGPWDLKTRPTDGPHSIRLCRIVITSKQNKYWVEMLTKIWPNKSHQTPCHAYTKMLEENVDGLSLTPWNFAKDLATSIRHQDFRLSALDDEKFPADIALGDDRLPWPRWFVAAYVYW